MIVPSIPSVDWHIPNAYVSLQIVHDITYVVKGSLRGVENLNNLPIHAMPIQLQAPILHSLVV